MKLHRGGTKEDFSRKDAPLPGRGQAKAARCHFDRREKSFLDPSHSLGMTDRGPSLGDLAGANPCLGGLRAAEKFAQAA